MLIEQNPLFCFQKSRDNEINSRDITNAPQMKKKDIFEQSGQERQSLLPQKILFSEVRIKLANNKQKEDETKGPVLDQNKTRINNQKQQLKKIEEAKELSIRAMKNNMNDEIEPLETNQGTSGQEHNLNSRHQQTPTQNDSQSRRDLNNERKRNLSLSSTIQTDRDIINQNCQNMNRQASNRPTISIDQRPNRNTILISNRINNLSSPKILESYRFDRSNLDRSSYIQLRPSYRRRVLHSSNLVSSGILSQNYPRKIISSRITHQPIFTGQINSIVPFSPRYQPIVTNSRIIGGLRRSASTSSISRMTGDSYRSRVNIRPRRMLEDFDVEAAVRRIMS